MAINHTEPPPLIKAAGCIRCGAVAAICLTTPEGERMYCITHFCALGEIPPHSAARPLRPVRLVGAA